MTLYTSRDRQTIKETVEFLITQGQEITAQAQGQVRTYASMIIKANCGGVHSKYGNRPHLVLGRLTPEDGNTSIKPGSQLLLKFSLSNSSCKFKAEYLGPRIDEPESELVVSFPESIELPERRRRNRNSDEIPEFVSVELRPKEGSQKKRKYELAVLDYSTQGVGILVSEKDSELFEAVQEGDRLEDITLHAPQSLVKVDGTVRHKSKKPGEEAEGCYVLGIQFDEKLIDLSSPS
jgi:c-di-GMP-binding flagellar brake protein YcgR